MINDELDFSLKNLREKEPYSVFKGVTYLKSSKWTVQLKINSKFKRTYHDTELKAIKSLFSLKRKYGLLNENENDYQLFLKLMREIYPERSKSLCLFCDKCEDFTYQRTTKKGKLFKFKYCKGNAHIIKKGNWGPDTSVSTGKTYPALTKRIKGKHATFTTFLKKNPENIMIHLENDSLDCRMRKLREVSKTFHAQSKAGGESIFPGVTRVSSYHKQKDKPWMARVKIKGKHESVGTFDTEGEAAHKYYTELEKRGIEINTETVAYQEYQRWLDIQKFMKYIVNDFADIILEDSQKYPDRYHEWYVEAAIKGLKKIFKEETDKTKEIIKKIKK